jgi:hypothetical protein
VRGDEGNSEDMLPVFSMQEWLPSSSTRFVDFGSQMIQEDSSTQTVCSVEHEEGLPMARRRIYDADSLARAIRVVPSAKNGRKEK